MRRFLADVLLVAGILMLLDAGATVLWEDPVSAVYTSIKQDELSTELDELERSERSRIRRAEARRRAASRRETAGRTQPRARRQPTIEERLRSRARSLAGRADAGDPVGRLEARDIELGEVLVQGADLGTLRDGPGHYPETGLPGSGRTIGIAGHRTTYGAPFRDADEFEPGDEITVAMPYGRFTYLVQGTEIVEPDALRVLRDVGYERLVLTACHPLYSAAQRIIVYARLDRRSGIVSGRRFEEPGGVPGGTYDPGGGPEGAVLAVVLLGMLSGIVGAGASGAALREAGSRKPDHLVITFACSLLAVVGLGLVLLGVIG